jgi:hypothetical protein
VRIEKYFTVALPNQDQEEEEEELQKVRIRDLPPHSPVSRTFSKSSSFI